MYWHVSAKPFYLEKTLQLFHENPKIGPLVFGKKSQILSPITLPASPLFHELWGLKKCGLYAPFYGTFQDEFGFQGLFKTALHFQVLFKTVRTLLNLWLRCAKNSLAQVRQNRSPGWD